MARNTFRISLQRACLALLVTMVLISVIAVQYVWLRRLSDRVDRLQRANDVLLCRVSPGRKTYASIGGKNVFFDTAAEFVDRENRIVVQNSGTELVVELNGVPIACQTLQIDLETGRWTKDDPRFFERLGVDLDVAVK
jgi:hypothetical protein